jgi:hypothetical protein
MNQENLVFFQVSCGIGMEYTYVYDCTGLDELAIDRLGHELAVECAESFGSFFSNEEDIPEDDEDDIFFGDRNFTEDDLDYYFEPYDPDKHDGQKQGGGSFLDDIQKAK